jgi:hypothetical protein
MKRAVLPGLLGVLGVTIFIVVGTKRDRERKRQSEVVAAYGARGLRMSGRGEPDPRERSSMPSRMRRKIRLA